MRRLHLPLLGCLVTTVIACSDSSDSLPAPEPLQARYELSSPDSVPEGITFDPVDREFYVTSLQGGSITRIDADGVESLLREADGTVSLGGIKVDPERRLLWVCATDVAGLGDQVWVYDLASGERESAFELAAISAGGSCNDLILDEEGFAYVTDPVNPIIYRLDHSTGVGEVFATDPRFADITGAGLGLNGIEVSPDGRFLVVAKFALPALFRVDLSDGATVRDITLSGNNLPSPDGLEFLDGDLYTVSNSSISRVRFSNDFQAGEVVTRDQISGLSTAAVAESGLYAIKSEVTNFVIGNFPLNLPFEFFRVDLAAFDAPIPPDA